MSSNAAQIRPVNDADLLMFRNYAGYTETRLEDSWRPDDEAEESLKDAAIEEPLIGGDRSKSIEQAHSYVSSRHRTSASSVAIAILKANLGSGILYLPRAWVNGGWLFSTLVLPILAFMAGTCSLRLVQCRRIVRKGGYGDIMLEATGSKFGRIMIDLSLLALQSGICTGYFVFVANMASDVSPWIASLPFSTKVLLQAAIITPLCWFRQVSKLSLTNLTANVLIILSLFGLVAFMVTAGPGEAAALHSETHERSYPPINFWDGGFLVFMGTALYVFEGIGLILPTYDSMKEPQKFEKVFSRAFAVTTASFLFIGLAGYYEFGPYTQTIVLSNLPQGSLLSSAVKSMYTLAVFITFPFQLLPAVRLVEYYSGYFPKQRHVPLRRKMAKNLFRLIYILFLAGIAMVAGRDLDHFISLIGSMCGLPLVFIAPPICHMKLIGGTNKSDMGILVFGVLVMISATISNIVSFGTH
ncbi:hypothetical protein FOL47_000031 [Perkinsus chesapeaki]|uniref:Amino acid transporter transmembrane domain-containing protein n=1 Tax=Perkinsus chesapeaki TaxID=330153 RepID=A0A7J6N305_PERCH|nr:hypothetical protein FOL47_000031 [Perkinsus chesapeaki]